MTTCAVRESEQLISRSKAILMDVCARIYRLPNVGKIILFGSYAKGDFSSESDMDLAVFFDTDRDCLLDEYRMVARICGNSEIDIQAQVFRLSELEEPCGIIEEIVTYGVEIRCV